MGGNGGDEGGGGDGDGGGGGGGGGGGRGGEGGGGEDGGGDEDGGTFTDVCGSSGSSELLLLSVTGMISASTTFALGPLPARASSMAAAASTASAVAGGRLAACSCMLVQSVVAFCSRAPPWFSPGQIVPLSRGSKTCFWGYFGSPSAPPTYRIKAGGAGTQTGHTGYTDHTDSPVPPGVCL